MNTFVNASGKELLLRSTRDMESAANALNERFDRTLIRAVYRVKPYIRFRSSLLAGEAYVIRHRAGNPDGWKRGACLWYREIPSNGAPPPCNAMLFAECPRSITEMKKLSANVSDVVVVYLPPTWEAHTASIMERTSPLRLQTALLNLREIIKLVESVPRFR